MQTTVTLWRDYSLVVPTIYCIWRSSRSTGPVPEPQRVSELIGLEREQNAPKLGPFEAEVLRTFEEALLSDLPLNEMVDFVFHVEGVPIALREQMVRYQIGHKFVLPGLESASFWMQSMRQMPMEDFADHDEYITPETVKYEGDNAEAGTPAWAYHNHMLNAQQVYRRLVESGVPMEDARNVLPLGACHRLVWKCNISAVAHTLARRSCWIAQLGLWEPVVRGMAEELATKVHPLFRRLVAPPCVDRKTNKFDRCRFPIENADYIRGKDPHPPCALWLNKHSAEAEVVENATKKPAWVALTVRGQKMKGPLQDRGFGWVPHPLEENATAYDETNRRVNQAAEKWDAMAKLWGMNPSTWEPL